MFYKKILKPILFCFNPEKAHFIAIMGLRIVCTIPGGKYLLKSLFAFNHPSLQRNVFGIKFPNPVGLAAGFDKDGKYFYVMQHLGFGFIEIGTVTPRPQDGNPKPRLFRLPADEALINRMGFNNEGLAALKKRLSNRKPGLIIGGNIGKNKDTSNEEAFEDYRKGFEELFELVDYFVVNVSSPNTPNLRALQEKEPLTQLLSHLQELNKAKQKPKPILLKIAPDLTEEQLDDIIEIVQNTNIAGIIATNTTISRSDLLTDKKTLTNIGNGGLSGKPVASASTKVIRYIYQKSGGKIPIIGVGGIHSPEDVFEKLQAGACLVQLYTGLIYEGPGLLKKINRYLVSKSR
ncbi:MAG: quinone-dependent dihydroorotate dehydrogenase [Saprospiraceae bacterium]|jgi:dihydroorotate dehydrogenase|nr:quinone-dependent dihydroorotate dehydrogenase [Saprospiraceae bacterium]